jgi:hypothetical protein
MPDPGELRGIQRAVRVGAHRNALREVSDKAVDRGVF